MPFLQSSLPFIYKEICDRRSYLKSFLHVEYDDDEYSQLLGWGSSVTKHYTGFNPKNQKEYRTVFLALACEYIRRNKFTDDNIFWEGFLHEIGVETGDHYGANVKQLGDLLWQAYKENGIPLLQGGHNRLIVKSLVSAVQASEADSEVCVDFFCWYYHHINPAKVTTEVLSQYTSSTNKDVPIHQKAIPRFGQDCEVLSRIVEHWTEEGSSFQSLEIGGDFQRIVEELGNDYDFTEIHFVRTPKQLKKIFERLKNYVTHLQFRKVIEISPPNVRLEVPYHHIILAHEYFQEKKYPYGCYKLDQVIYRVVPQSWMSLAAIAEYPDKQVVTLRKGFVTYKKSVRFQVRIGNRFLESQECFLETGELCHIWVGMVPRGEPFWVDGRLCSFSEGENWSISVAMGWDDARPILLLRCDALKVFFGDKRGAPLAITTSQDHEWKAYLSLEGQLRKTRSIVFPLKPDESSVSLSLALEDQVLDEKMVSLQPAYLFSSMTFDTISCGSSSSREGHSFYLFALAECQLVYDEQYLDIELLEDVWGYYSIYHIIWDNDGPFRLKAGSCSWEFLKQSYFFVQIVTDTRLNGPFHFATHQVQQFSAVSLRVVSNMDVASSSVSCQVVFMEDIVFQVDLCSFLSKDESEPHSYAVKRKFFEDLDLLIREQFGNKCYGRYDFFFYQDGRLLDTSTLVRLPPIQLTADINQLVLKQEPLHIDINILAPLPLWNAQQNCLSSTTTLSIYPSAKRTVPLQLEQYEGIFGLDSESIVSSIVFPSIDEVLELVIRPTIFDIQLYQKQQVGQSVADYKSVQACDYYMLKNTALYVFTRPSAQVSLYYEGRCIQREQADDHGNFLLTDWYAIQQQCKRELTEIVVSCEERYIPFTIHWLPMVYHLSVEDGIVEVDLNGPLCTSIVFDIVDIDQTLLDSVQFMCRGERYHASFELPVLCGATVYGYIIPRYIVAGNVSIVGAQQWRISLRSQWSFLPESWLQAGMGISSDQLFISLMSGQ